MRMPNHWHLKITILFDIELISSLTLMITECIDRWSSCSCLKNIFVNKDDRRVFFLSLYGFLHKVLWFFDTTSGFWYKFTKITKTFVQKSQSLCRLGIFNQSIFKVSEIWTPHYVSKWGVVNQFIWLVYLTLNPKFIW